MKTAFYCVPKSQDIMHYGVKGMKWGVRRESDDGSSGFVGRAIGNSYKVNKNIEQKKSQIANKFGAKKHAQVYKNNADYYEKTRQDLLSGKVGKPKTRYQKFTRALGKSNFATVAVLANKGPGKLSKQAQAQALYEQHLMREADGWYKKRAKRMAAIKVAEIGYGAYSSYKKRK